MRAPGWRRPYSPPSLVLVGLLLCLSLTKGEENLSKARDIWEGGASGSAPLCLYRRRGEEESKDGAAVDGGGGPGGGTVGGREVRAVMEAYRPRGQDRPGPACAAPAGAEGKAAEP